MKSNWQHSQGTERNYSRQLRAVGREIGKIIKKFNPKTPADFPPLRVALERYEKLLKPWAAMRAAEVVNRINKNNQRIWAEQSKSMSRAMRLEIQNAPIGERLKELMRGQVALITSLPREAAQRVHELVIKNAEQQNRSKTFIAEIMRSGKVTESRATTIARTEVSRTASVLTQARAEYVGSDGYIWRTVHDADVRPSHKKMDGKFVRYDEPPTLDGLTGHAGALPNCRCYQEPVIPKELL